MKRIGRLVFNPDKDSFEGKSWKGEIGKGTERFSFIIYKEKGKYLVSIKEKFYGTNKIHTWNRPIKSNRIFVGGNIKEMTSIIGRSKGKITINTLPKDIKEKVNREIILYKLK